MVQSDFDLGCAWMKSEGADQYDRVSGPEG